MQSAMPLQQRNPSIHLEIDPKVFAAQVAREASAAVVGSHHPWKDTTGVEYGFCRKAGDEFYIRIHEVGSFAGNAGRDLVWAAPEAGTPLDQLRGVFYTEVVPFLLQQRAWEVLHACGLGIDGAWVALSGRSQVGKSTLAHAWRRRGGHVYADDAIPFRVEGRRVSVCPLPFQIRLRAPSARYFGDDSQGERPWLSILSARTLSAVFMLERHPGAEGLIRVEALEPARALRELLHQAYAYAPCDRTRTRALVESYIDLANVLPSFRLSYPTVLDGVDAALDEILATMASLGTEQ